LSKSDDPRIIHIYVSTVQTIRNHI
jgi:hypothetical protein